VVPSLSVEDRGFRQGERTYERKSRGYGEWLSKFRMGGGFLDDERKGIDEKKRSLGFPR